MSEWYRHRDTGSVLPAATVTGRISQGCPASDFIASDIHGHDPIDRVGAERPRLDVATLSALSSPPPFPGHPIHYPFQWPRADVEIHVRNSWAGSRHERVVRPLSRLRAMYFVEVTRPRRVLDIGCGGCYTLQAAVARHWPPEGVVGIEPIDVQEVPMPEGFVLHFGFDMHEMTPEALGTFDLVLGTHSGYRSYDLPRFLKRLAAVLRLGGGAYVDFFCDEMPALYNSPSQTVRRCPDPQPYVDEVARVWAAAEQAKLNCVAMPFFGRAALSAGYGFKGEAPPKEMSDLIDVLAGDPQDAKAASGYFTAALWHKGTA